MAESTNSKNLLLENETIRNQVSPFVQEQILLPTVAEDGSDIEILEENITKKTLKKKKKNKLKNDLHKMKKLNSSSQDSITDVCGLQVTIKSLLKNDEIRKQIAPFIEEVVIDCSDSGSEENSSSVTTLVHKVAHKNNELTDEQILDKAKDVVAKSLTKLKNKSKPTKQKHTSNHLIDNNKVMDINKSQAAEKIHILDLTDDISDDDVALSERIKNKKLIKKSKTKTKKFASVSEPNQNSIILENNCESLITEGNIFVIDGLQQSHENIESKHVELPDLPITESDDWYYLNIARAPKDTSSIEDDIWIIQNSLKLNEISNNIEVEEKLLLPTPSKDNKIETEKAVNDAVVHRKRKRRRRKRWTIYGNRNTKKDNERLQSQNSNLKNIVNKEKNRLYVDNGNQVANLKNAIGSMANNIIEDRAVCFENGIIESHSNSKKNLTFSHEVIPIIKKETESMDSVGSEVSQCADINTSTIKIGSNDDCTLNNGVFKPMLKPYRIKEITPDFYRNEANDYKTYQKTSIRRNTTMTNIQIRLANSREARYKDKSLFKKRPRFVVPCSKCGKKYERSCYLKRHEKICKTNTKTTKGETDIQCPQCPYKTRWKHNYLSHATTHSVGQKLVNAYESQMHVKCTMCPLIREPYQRGTNCIKCHSYYKYLCRMCGKDYPTYTSLKVHVLSNIQLGCGRTCHKCGKGGYASLCSLKRHVRVCGTLDGESQDKIICNKIPYVRLVRHEDESKESHQMNIHCSQCDKFSTTSEREAKCEMCFADVSYKCELCNEFLPSYSNLQYHVLNVHIMDTGGCLENKNEASDAVEEKIDSDSNEQFDNTKQRLRKGDTSNCNSPKVQMSEEESRLTEKENERLDSFDEFVSNLKENSTVFAKCEVDDHITDESIDGPNKISDPKFSEDANIKISDNSLSDIVNSNVTKDKTCDSRLNEKCIQDRKDAQPRSLKRQYKTCGIKRYCLRCDKIKKDLDVIRVGPKKEICEKCRSELMYQCIKCKRKSNIYSVMLYHWKHYCAYLRPKYSTVKLTVPEKCKNSNICNRIQRHQCQLCAYSSNLKSRLMLHLQMHSWKDIKSAVFTPDNRSDT